MNANTMNTIQMEVNAAFRLNIADQIAEIVHSPYVSGIFAAEDYRIGASMLSDARTRLVNLMPGYTKAQLEARPGSKLYIDRDAPLSEFDLERRVELQEVQMTISVIEGVLEHLVKKANDEQKRVWVEGGKKGDFWPFRPFITTFSEVLAEKRTWANEELTGETLEKYIAKLDEAASLSFSDFPGYGMGVNAALSEFHKMLKEGDNVDRVSFNAWKKLRGNLAAWYQAYEAFEDERAVMNEFRPTDPGYNSAMSEFSKINKLWNRQDFKLQAAIKNSLSCVNLLAHMGPPADLIQSPEWITEETKAATMKLARDNAKTMALIRQVEASKEQVKVAEMLAANKQRLAELLDPSLAQARLKAEAKAAAKAEAKVAAKAAAKTSSTNHVQQPVLTLEAPKGAKPNGSATPLSAVQRGIPSYNHR